MSCSVTYDCLRITAITDRLLRIETAPFCDDPSLRADRPQPVGELAEEEPGTLKTGAGLKVTVDPTARRLTRKAMHVQGTIAGCTVDWRPGKKDRGNLHGAKRTVDSHHGNQLWNGEQFVDAGDEPGFCSKDGWVLVDESATPIMERGKNGRRWPAARPKGARDLFLFCHGHDYEGALADAARVFGRQPLPPRKALGYWWSRWWAYTDRELEALVDQFDRMGLPLDQLVLDMEWHKPGWSGYTWEDALFPDHKDFLAKMCGRGLQVALNLHPAGGVSAIDQAHRAMAAKTGTDPRETVAFDCTDPGFVEAYFSELHHPNEEAGVGVWWMDWQQGKNSGLPGLDPLPWLNKLHWEDQARRRPNRRPLVFSRYGGLGGGRYPMGFSGDIESSWRSLQYLLRLTSESANSLFGYWSHDTGGFFCSPWEGPTTPELYLRWMQAACHWPILRTHCGRDPNGDRRFWLWGEPHGSLMMRALRERYELVPYLYTACRASYDTARSLVRPLYYHHPEEKQAYKHGRQYYLGDDLLMAPVCEPADDAGLSPARFWLPKGEWIDAATGEALEGGRTYRRRYALEEIPRFVRPGAIIPGQPCPRRLEPGGYKALLLTVYAGGNGRTALYEDDGISEDYRSGAGSRLPLSTRGKGATTHVSIGVIEGDFAGIVRKRPVRVRLPHALPPAAVRCNGKSLGFTYDDTTCTTLIDCGELEHTRHHHIEIRWRPGGRPSDARGLTGALVRCRLAFEALRATCHEILRPAASIAQTANRIGRKPARLKGELGMLPERIAALRRELSAIARTFDAGSKRGPETIAACTQAKKLLAAAREML